MNKPVVGAQLNFNQTAAARRFASCRLAVGAGVLAALLSACGGQPENTLTDARAALEAQQTRKKQTDRLDS
jgi:hypothetical protein